MTNSTPFLSVVIAVRHREDDDFTSRFLGALRFNHEQLSTHGVPHEFVLVVLNAGTGASFTDVAAEVLTWMRDETLSVFVVDPRYHDAFRVDAGTDCIERVAKNVGIRRARGVFVLSIGCGVYLGRRVLGRIAEGTVETGILYHAVRVDVRIGVPPAAVSLDVLEQPRNVITRPRAPHPPLYVDGASDFVLLDRASSHELRGFNEIHPMARVDVDDIVSKARLNGYPIQSLGAPVYHAYDGPTAAASVHDRADSAEAPGPHSDAARVDILNSDTWGLSAAPERQLGPRRVWLEFDWSVVPALVDLNKVVLRTPAL